MRINWKCFSFNMAMVLRQSINPFLFEFLKVKGNQTLLNSNIFNGLKLSQLFLK